MENASKALAIAGGVIIAVMIIATLLYASSTWTIIPRQEEETAAVKQLAAFNQQYESYNRDALYGTDLVSVLNKAIDNNERYGAKPGERLYINIIFKLKSDVDGTTTTYLQYENESKQVLDQVTLPGVLKVSHGSYSLQNDLRVIKEEFLANFYGTKIKGSIYYGKDGHGKYQQYEERVSAGSEFKTRIFKCVGEHGGTGVVYDDEGRIKSMRFEEQIVEVE